MDICYITPGGRRLRTFPEIQRHLDLKQEDNKLGIENFTFSKKVDLGEMLDTDKVRITLFLRIYYFSGSNVCIDVYSLYRYTVKPLYPTP